MKLILEPIFESDFQDWFIWVSSEAYSSRQQWRECSYSSYNYRGQTKVIDVDLKSYFDTVRHDILLNKIAARINDNDIMKTDKANTQSRRKARGVAQGGPLSPLLSNIYLNEVDKMLEEGEGEVTKTGELLSYRIC